MKQMMTSKCKRFIKCTMLLLMLLTCGTNAFAQTYDEYETLGGEAIDGVLYEYWLYRPWPGLEEYIASVVGFDDSRANVTILARLGTYPSPTGYAPDNFNGFTVGHMRYARNHYLETLSSTVVETITFKGSPNLEPKAGSPTFNCPNLTDLYFEGASPNLYGAYENYFSSPSKGTITIHLSDKTLDEIYELKKQPIWKDFKDIVSMNETAPKRNINMSISHARVSVGDNNYVNDQSLMVDMYTDFTFNVAKLYGSDYKVQSVKMNGREIFPEMTYTQGGTDANSYYSYTIAPLLTDTYIEVKGEYIYNTAGVICSDGGKWCKEGSSSSYNLPNDNYSVRWLKSEEAPNILIVPDEGCTLDRIYSNSQDVTGNAHDNGNGTFSYKLTANANVSVTFKEMPTTTTWNVITLGGAYITATFKNKRGEELAYTLTNGENAVPDDAQSMTMRIDAEEGKTLVVTADGVDLSSYFRFDEEWTGEYDDELIPINEYYYHTTTPIPANKLKAKNWTIGVKDTGSQAITWALQAKGDLPETWSASIYLDDQTPLLSISNQNPSASASNASPSGELLKVAINGGDGYVFNLTLNGQTVISSSHCINGEFETEDQDFIAPLLTNGTWAVEFSQKPVDVIHFADAEVRRICLINWDTDRDGELSKAEAAAVTTLKKDENPLFQSNKDITSFDELQYFTGLNSIEEGCFTGCEHLQSIVLPSSIQSIGNSAFSGCKALNGISLPEGVQTIGDYAFSGTNIETFYLPKNVTQIGRGILSWNDKLVSIAVSPENQTFDSRKGCNAIIRKSDLFLMAGCANTVIPEDVKYLFYSAFEGTRNLTEIVLPAGLLSVGQDVFRYCSALTSVVAKMETPVDVYTNELGVTSFTDISAECVLTVPAGKTDAYIAAGWTIKETDTPDGLFLRIEEAQPVVDDDIIVFADANVKAICVANWDTNHDGELSKAEAAAVKTLIVNEISVFRDKSSIKSFNELQYFTGLTSIEADAFYGCGALASVKLPESITQLNNSCFSHCTSLKHIQLPAGLETINDLAFGYSGLTSIFIPKSITSIGNGVFTRCTQLQSIVVEEGNEKYSSPNGCNAIVYMYDFLSTAIPTLLAGCKNTTIPENVCWILQSAFSGQTELTKIVIPSNVYRIAQNAFNGCNNLTSIVMERTEPFDYAPSFITGVGTDAFKNISADCVLTVPYGTRQAYLDAGWSESVFKGGIVEDKSQYDVNRDGEMNITDVTTLVNKILGK